MGLSPLDLDRDVADLHVAYADARVMSAWLYEEASADVAETRRRLARRRDAPGARLWSVRRTGAGVVLGLVELIGGTSPPGLSWMLRRDAWGQGLMGEAIPVVVAHLLADGGLDRVEAWADATNKASIKVAKRAGLTERGRFAFRHPDGMPHETVVLGRWRVDRTQEVYGAEAVLPVRDVSATVDLLCAALGVDTSFLVGSPVYRAGVRFGPWSGSRGLQLVTAGDREQIGAVTIYVHCGARVADLYERVIAANGRVDEPPADMPWGRVEFTVRLLEGHRLVVSGPV